MTKRKIKVIVEGEPGGGKSKTAVSIFDLIALANADVRLLDGVHSDVSVPPLAHSDLSFHGRLRDAVANIHDLSETVEFEVVTRNKAEE